MKLVYVLLTALFAVSPAALAGPRTITLDVSGMTCPACPITVKKALEQVDGVTNAKVQLETHQAVVHYDDRRTNEKIITDATFEAGYPSRVIGKSHAK